MTLLEYIGKHCRRMAVGAVARRVVFERGGERWRESRGEEAFAALLECVWRRGLAWDDFASEEHVRAWVVSFMRNRVRSLRWNECDGKRRLAAVAELVRWPRGAINGQGDERRGSGADRVASVLAAMPPHRVEALMLRYVAGVKLAEAARMHGNPCPALFLYHLRRARDEFRRRWEGTWVAERRSSFKRRRARLTASSGG